MSSPLLIIDEDPDTLSFIKSLLIEEGYTVFVAREGREALKILQENPIDLILSDLRLPDMTGIDILIKAQELHPYQVRILFTANTDQETAVQAINFGHVHHFIPKPWNSSTLKHTVKMCLEKYELEKEMRSMQELIIEHHKELAKAHKILQGQLEIGSKIHETLLIGEIPENVPGLSVEALNLTSHDISGNFFEFYRPLVDLLDVAIGDVMGKGIPAALIGTAVKTQILRYAVPSSRSMTFDPESKWPTGWLENIAKVDDIINGVHGAISQNLIKLDFFVSLFYARFDLKKRKLSFVDCGFTKPIHWHAEERKATFLQGENFPLGMMSEESYQLKQVPFKEKDIFVFYSDGLSKAQSLSGKIFETASLVRLIDENSDLSASEIVNIIKVELKKFHGKEVFDDDLTLIVVKVDHFLKIEKLSPGGIHFAADLSQLKAVRDFIVRAVHQGPGDPSHCEILAQDLKLAINEIFCNIVKHGSNSGLRKKVRLQVDYDTDGIWIEIADQGTSFDPLKITEPSLCGDKDDGYGWYIIRQLVDKVVYLPKKGEEEWNHLRLFKKYYETKNNMELSFILQDNVLVITPLGENLDAKESPEFKEKVFKMIEENHASHVIFDLKELKFIDSSGLGSFLSVLRKLNAQGGDLKLVGLSRPVKSMFELVSMHKIFDIYSTTQDALKA